MNDDRRILRASTFDEVAELYDRSRIGPPEQLFDDLFTLAEIAPPADSSVLEVGCGTGQATQQLARRGCRVVCVEMGANLARIARRNLAQFPNVTVMTTRFEDWEPCDERFDIVLAVTSWHWIDPEVRYAKAARVLEPEGVLAFTTGAHVFPPGFDPFFIEIQLCYDALGEGYAAGWSPAPPEHIPDAREEIERSGYFEDVRIARYIWATDFNADQYVDMMSTASDHRLLEPAKRERLFTEMRRLINARPAGQVRKHQLTILHVAHRKPELVVR
jgi:SAM-dependent methyltransferase